MTLWFGLTLMTAAAVWAVLWPLARRGNELRSGSDVAVYRDQLAEVERDRAAGLIGESEAAGARVEVSRRLIAAADAQTVPPSSVSSATRRRRAVAVVALVGLPLGAAAFYLALGSPSLPDQPLAPRLAASRSDASVDTLIAQVEDHLSRHPEDGRGWEVIAPVYLRLGRFDDAIKARRNALRLNGATAERVTASSQLGPEQRRAMIEGMVERLSERLHRDGADVEGWLRLVRSYLVLGQPEKARAAVIDARRALAGDAIKLRRLDDLLRGLGLEG